jgi:hypothetical protein
MAGVSKRFKVILLVLGVLMVGLSGGMGYLTHGLGETEGLVINDVDLSHWLTVSIRANLLGAGGPTQWKLLSRITPLFL